MRRLAICLLILFSTTSVWAAEASKFGLGLILGAPTALSAKKFVSETRAWDAGLAYDFDDSFTVFGDYLRHWPNAFSDHKEKFAREISPYAGVGALFHNSKDPYRDKKNQRPGQSVVNLIARVPLGLEWNPGKTAVGVFLEIVPGIFLAPEVAASVMGGIGVRYYF